ncbi:putative alkaline shock family protein YloU [Melghirimyces profundicolus]|uniref:Putative alkaline shock family protein YloU n=1 Tax=Melghirimyces profundicolus TaxID=1242148 RepID=A0A2T6BD09_9BACL|nr:alkaline shock response membrane anchor protein AmaP [Melghirimyces profundicolus]PTX53926.1 putative alkaline shock family protein YloU [Melghirimyces profundicolus]
MGVLNRLLLLGYGLLFLMVATLGLSFAFKFGLDREGLEGWVNKLYRNPGARWTVAAVSAMILAFSLRLLWVTVHKDKEDPGVDRLTEIGHIRISCKTLESLAIKAAHRVKGIRDLSARVRQDAARSSVGIGLKLTVEGDTPIQVLSEQLQQSVKTHVEEIAGVDVSQISVYIVDTVQPDRSRIRVE